MSPDRKPARAPENLPLKTHTTALVLLPPPMKWEPIQAIRRAHDRQFRRWMPHITLLYPFRPREEFEAITPLLAAVLDRVDPFQVHLRQFRRFQHGPRSWTLWLAPEPPEPIREIVSRLLEAFPECTETSSHRGGYTPHLSVGQCRGRLEDAAVLLESLQGSWKPLSFTVTEIHLIRREAPPEDVFRVDRHFPLRATAG